MSAARSRAVQTPHLREMRQRVSALYRKYQYEARCSASSLASRKETHRQYATNRVESAREAHADASAEYEKAVRMEVEKLGKSNA